MKHFLSGLNYPLYYLDFETFNTAIPMFDGLSPHQQVPRTLLSAAPADRLPGPWQAGSPRPGGRSGSAGGESNPPSTRGALVLSSLCSGCVPGSKFLQPLLPVLASEHLEHFFAGAFLDDLLEIEVLLDTMVGHAVLGKIIGSDSLAPVAGTDLAAAQGLFLFLALALNVVIDPGAQHPHGLCPVLVLRGLILDGDDEAGGEMGEANGRAGAVDLLPARAGCPKEIDPQVSFLDLDLHLLGLIRSPRQPLGPACQSVGQPMLRARG